MKNHPALKGKIKKEFAFNSADHGIVKKGDFATVVTTSYNGKAYEEVFSKILGGAPTVAAFKGVKRIKAGYKSEVQVPVLTIDATALFQSFDNDCDHIATNSQSFSYVEVKLNKMGILDEVCAEKFVGDYSELNMPVGANDVEVPQPWEDALISKYSEAQARGVEGRVWTIMGPILESGTAGGANAPMFDTTATLAAATANSTVRSTISAFLVGYATANPEINLADLVLVLPVAVNAALQLTFVNNAVDATENASAQFGNIFGVNSILASYAHNQNRMYLININYVIMATDGVEEWTGIDIINLGLTDAKKKGTIQYSNMFRFGLTLMLPEEAGVLRLTA